MSIERKLKLTKRLSKVLDIASFLAVLYLFLSYMLREAWHIDAYSFLFLAVVATCLIAIPLASRSLVKDFEEELERKQIRESYDKQEGL